MLFTITTGVEKTHDGRDISTYRAEQVTENAIRIATTRFGGVTVTEHRGGYRNNAGVLVIERSISFTIISTFNDVTNELPLVACALRVAIADFAAFLRVALEQESVLVVEQATDNISFI